MNDLIEALQILVKYQVNMGKNFTTCEYNDFTVYINDIKHVTNEDFKKLQSLDFYVGIQADNPSNAKEEDEFQERLGGMYDDSITDTDIEYLKTHCSNAFHSYKWAHRNLML